MPSFPPDSLFVSGTKQLRDKVAELSSSLFSDIIDVRIIDIGKDGLHGKSALTNINTTADPFPEL